MLTCKFLLVQICTLACGFVLCANLHVESANCHVKMRICTDANSHSCKFSLGVQICSGVDLHSDCKFGICTSNVSLFSFSCCILTSFPKGARSGARRKAAIAEKRQCSRVSLRSGGVCVSPVRWRTCLSGPSGVHVSPVRRCVSVCASSDVGCRMQAARCRRE